MGDTKQLSWTCTCGRRVPLRVGVCHCGAARAEAPATEAPATAEPGPAEPTTVPATASAVWSSMPGDVKAMAVASVLVLAAGLGWTLFGPARTDRPPALLGWVDTGPPPLPRPTPSPRPPFKLPWWK